MAQEIFDGEPVAFYRAKFNGATFTLDPEWAAESAQMGKLPIVLAMCRVGKPLYDDDKDGDRFKQVTFLVEEAVPLTGEMRTQASIFLAHEGQDGVIDFPTSADSQRLQQALRQQDRLAEFIAAEFGDDVLGEGETPVETAIRLLSAVKRMGEQTTKEAEAHMQDADDTRPVTPPAPGGSVVPPIPPESEIEVKPRAFQRAPFDPDDVEDFEVRDDHEPAEPGVERVGTLHGAGHEGKTRQLLDDVFADD